MRGFFIYNFTFRCQFDNDTFNQNFIYIDSKLVFLLCGHKILVCQYYTESRTNAN